MRSYRISVSILVVLVLGLAGELAYLYWQEHQPRESPYDPIIVAVAREEGVDPFLVRAVVWRESHFDAQTHGAKEDNGLMQVTPDAGVEWAKANKVTDFKPEDLFDPKTNVEAGTWYLARAIKHWSQTDDPVPFALAEYNAGRGNANRWVDPNAPQDHLAFMNRITYPSTRKYVEDILEKRDEYRMTMARDRWYREFATANPTVTESQ